MDRRQRKTRRSIYTAFESLMAEEHYSAVTVAQIIERADIGRSTFYAHFETKDELIDQMCTEMFAHIFEGVNEHCTTHADLETTDLGGVLAHLLYHLRDTHAGVCGKLLIEGEPHFNAYFSEQLATLFERRCQPPADVPAELFTMMMVASFVQAITWWFKNDATQDPEELSKDYLAAWRLVEVRLGTEPSNTPN